VEGLVAVERGGAEVKFLIGAAIGYVLGAKAGRERYEQIVSGARKVTGSQTMQSTAGVLQAQITGVTARVKGMRHQGDKAATPNGRPNAL
jgi:hypothetical protein